MNSTKQLFSRLRKRAFLILLLLSLAAVAAPLGSVKGWFSASAATTFTVNSTGDGGDNNLGDGLCNDGAGNCTLRAAIQQANALAGADTIQFSVNGTINLTSALPDLSTDMTITGPGSGLLTVRRDTGGDYRVLTVGIPNVSNVTVSISGLTVTNGKTADGANTNTGTAGNGQIGGGVLNYSTLTMTDVAVTGNRTGAGGVSPVFGGEGGDGGGVFNAGTLTMNNCSVTGNFTGNGGEGNNGGGNGGEGGGILNANLLTMTGGTVSNNTTGTAGPTVGIGRTGGRGGGIFSAAVLNLTGVSVSNNTTGDGSPGANAFGGHGGGLFLDGGSATLTNCTVSGNTTGQSPTGTNGYGGGIENSAALTVRNSTISGNTGNAGGAILNRLALNLTNSTVSGNHLSGSGGAIFSSDSFSSLRLTNSTIAFNDGPGVTGNTGSGFIRNTIIARNNAGGVGPDATGNFTSQGHNLVGNADGAAGFTAAGDQKGTSAAPINPQLGPLANNGGPTLTHALLTGSPALDAGNNALALDPSGSPLTTDQRGPGFPRVLDSEDADTVATVDIGAYEKEAFTGPVNNPPTFTKGPDQIVSEDAGPQVVPGWATNISAGAGDTGQTVTFIVTGNTNPALFSAAPAVSPDGTLTYTPAPNTSGSATITIVLKDNGGTANGGQDTSAPQSFVITVTPVNDPPVAAGDAYNVNEDTTLNVNAASGVLANDTDVDNASLTASLVTNTTNGTLTLNADGSFTYTPNANFNGTDTFTYRASDGAAQSNTATVNITVNAVNDPPVAANDAYQTVQNTPLNVSAPGVLSNDTDTEGATLTAVQVAGPSNGTLTLNADGSFTYTPNAGFNGTDTFTYKASDGAAQSDAATVTITVNAGGSLRLSAAAYEVEEAGGNLVVTVTRADGSAGAATVAFATSNGTATAGSDYTSASGTLSFAAGETSKSFSVFITDDSAHEDDETFTVTLSNVTGSASLGSPNTAAVTIRDDDPAGGRFEFAQASFTVAERGGGITITVRRTGDVSRAASVGYLTDDGAGNNTSTSCSSTGGIALSRCDFTLAIGRLDFAAGESEKTFEVLITDDSYFEGTESLTLRLDTPEGGAVLGQQATASLQITDDAPESSGNPIDNAADFVRQHYHDFFGRQPDASGLAFWTNQITECGTNAACIDTRRQNVSAAFFLSIEFQETGYLVYRAHKASFDDLPGVSWPVEMRTLLSEMRRIGAGVIVNEGDWEQRLEQNKQAYFSSLVQTESFTQQFPLTMTPQQFVEKLNQNADGALSPAERDDLINKLAANQLTRAQVVRAVAEDRTLYDAEYRRAFVYMEYVGYLRRDPDPEGFGFWLGKLNDHNGNYISSEMIRSFLVSGEYRGRFGR